MIRTLILVGMEFKRIVRSRPSMVVSILVPAIGIISHASAGDSRTGAAIACFFPAAALFIAFVFFYVRGLVDRASGFAGGLESTPAAGMMVYGAKLMACILLALIQTGMFYAVDRIVG